MYRIIENKAKRVYYVVHIISGVLALETENKETAEKRKKELNDFENLYK